MGSCAVSAFRSIPGRERDMCAKQSCAPPPLQDNGGDEHWYSFSHTFPTARALSYEALPRKVGGQTVEMQGQSTATERLEKCSRELQVLKCFAGCDCLVLVVCNVPDSTCNVGR